MLPRILQTARSTLTKIVCLGYSFRLPRSQGDHLVDCAGVKSGQLRRTSSRLSNWGTNKAHNELPNDVAMPPIPRKGFRFASTSFYGKFASYSFPRHDPLPEPCNHPQCPPATKHLPAPLF
ncbi:hypothetical protein CDD81_3428 [Ophiocordyceps australis]|uniref:Uncharacterized protein n=1 Tax=Ophiocordyceps australis TaxID=1399860 RepID=A0A2C5YC33_9HYPO|nr:hypothetical protein CDD81_3428 [Ophiocordyceps australis]